MVYTKQTGSIGCGWGRGASRAIATRLGPRGGVGVRNRTTSSWTNGHSRIAISNSRGSVIAPMGNYSYTIKEEPHVEYTPLTPTREDLHETIDNLQIENSELITELARVQYDHAKLEEKWNKVLAENEELLESNHNLAWKCLR